MKIFWRSVDRWGPGAVAIVALIAVLWYGRQLEGRQAGLQRQVAERTEMELGLRFEVETWQAYVVLLRERMIQAGIKNIPPPPKPVRIRQGQDGRAVITTEGSRRKKE